MIVLAMLVYGAFFEGISVPIISFIMAALFDLSMTKHIFG